MTPLGLGEFRLLLEAIQLLAHVSQPLNQQACKAHMRRICVCFLLALIIASPVYPHIALVAMFQTLLFDIFPITPQSLRLWRH
jgi:hypothetical protein